MRQSTCFRVLRAGTLVCAIIFVAWQISARPDALRPPASEAPALERLAQQNRARIERLQSEPQRSRVTLASADGAAARYDADLIAEVQQEIRIFASARTMFNRDELMRVELERVSRNPRHVALAVELATDWRLASTLFGDDQAESRVYALQLLRHLAEAGDPQWVETAVDRIGATLNTEPTWTKGIEHDYVDALSIYLRSVGIDRFLADQASYYDRMHLTERTSLEVQKAVHDSGILNEASTTTIAQVRKEFFSHLGKEPPHG